MWQFTPMTGYVVAIADLVERHRVERAAYRRMLNIADRHTSITPPWRSGPCRWRWTSCNASWALTASSPEPEWPAI